MTRVLQPALLLIAACLCWPVALAAQDASTPPASAPPTPEPKLIARDLLVLQADRFGDTANDPTRIQTTLFNGVPHRGRIASDSGGPMPLGLITFEGQIDEPMRVRLDLPNAGSLFHAHWPEDAQKGEALIDWFQVRAAGEGHRPASLPGDHWLAPLRTSDDRLWLALRDPRLKERFLLYDAALPYKPPYALNTKEGRYRVTRADDAAEPPALTMLVQRDGDGWIVDTLDTPWLDGPTPISNKPSTTPPATLYAQAMSPLAEALTQRGYNAVETELALGMVRSAGLDRSLMSLVYIMPADQIDEHLWLRFRPQPDRVVRTVIVVVTNIDPDLGSRVQTLIADLGSDSWAKRDHAQRALTEMGQAAIEQVQQQRDHADPEVAFRARQILEAYDLRTQDLP